MVVASAEKMIPVAPAKYWAVVTEPKGPFGAKLDRGMEKCFQPTVVAPMLYPSRL